MKVIKDLTITVTYTVGLSDVEVSDEVYEALSSCYDEGGEVSPDSFDKHAQIASEWMADNIHEADAMAWEYEIVDLNEN